MNNTFGIYVFKDIPYLKKSFYGINNVLPNSNVSNDQNIEVAVTGINDALNDKC